MGPQNEKLLGIWTGAFLLNYVTFVQINDIVNIYVAY